MRCSMVLLLALAILAPAGAQESKKGSAKEPAPKPQATEKEQPAGTGEAATPSFRGKGEEAFKKGQELFEAEKYKDALAEMKRAKDQGKTPADKELVQSWVSACEGGIALENYKKEAEHGAASRVYFYTVDALDKS